MLSDVILAFVRGTTLAEIMIIMIVRMARSKSQTVNDKRL